MSIASELTALNGYILGAYDEINTKGGTVPTNKNMANLASAISSIETGGGGGDFDLSSVPNLTGVTSAICQPFSEEYFNILQTPQLPSGASIRLLLVVPKDQITLTTYTLRALFYISIGSDSGEQALTDDTFSFWTYSYGTGAGSIGWGRMGGTTFGNTKAPTASNWSGRILEHSAGATSWRPFMPYASSSSTSSTYKTKLVSGANYLIVVGW